MTLSSKPQFTLYTAAKPQASKKYRRDPFCPHLKGIWSQTRIVFCRYLLNLTDLQLYCQYETAPARYIPKPLSVRSIKSTREEMIMKQPHRSSKLGLAPGSLIFTGLQKMSRPQLQLIQYSEAEITESNPQNIHDAIALMQKYSGTSWLNIDGLHDVDMVDSISSFMNMHKLGKEDLLSVNQRPKLEEYDDHLHIVLRMATPDRSEFEQVSMVIKDRYLVSFQEQTDDTFDYVRKRLMEGKGQIRKKAADYLLYALLDSIVDYYFVVLEKYGDTLNEIETELLEKPEKETLNKIYHHRKEMLEIRRSIYPLRDLFSKLEKVAETTMSENLAIYLRDLYDHSLRLVEGIEGYRDTVSGLVDLYMNSASNRMNEIMKVLTIIATIFIPLTFIAGVYGMNFHYMPELQFRSAYFIVWGVMIVIFASMIWYFRRKKWL